VVDESKLLCEDLGFYENDGNLYVEDWFKLPDWFISPFVLANQPDIPQWLLRMYQLFASGKVFMQDFEAIERLLKNTDENAARLCRVAVAALLNRPENKATADGNSIVFNDPLKKAAMPTMQVKPLSAKPGSVRDRVNDESYYETLKKMEKEYREMQDKLLGKPYPQPPPVSSEILRKQAEVLARASEKPLPPIGQPYEAGSGITTKVRTPKSSNKAAWSSTELRKLQANIDTYDAEIALLFDGLLAVMRKATRNDALVSQDLDFDVNFGTPSRDNSRQLSISVRTPVACRVAVKQSLDANGVMTWEAGVYDWAGIKLDGNMVNIKTGFNQTQPPAKDAQVEVVETTEAPVRDQRRTRKVII